MKCKCCSKAEYIVNGNIYLCESCYIVAFQKGEVDKVRRI